MNTINNTLNTTYTNAQQHTQNKSNQKVETSSDIEINSLDIEYTKGYDLENITPKETYALGRELYDKGEIDVYKLASFFIIAVNHEHPPGTLDKNSQNANNTPFNLLKELEEISSGTHEFFIYGNEKHKNDTKDLLALLVSLPEESLKIKQTSINVSV